ncbi:MAG TPA: hypothetical protein DCG49_02755, partial [Ruminococcus sp.]|nr:hypothetical protein [Ruminococcus sp.]
LLMGRISEVYKSGKTYTEKENPLHQNDLVVEYMKAAGKNPYEQIDFWGMCAKAYHKNMSGSPGSLSPQGYLFVSEWGSCRYNTAVQLCMLIYDKYNKGVDKDYEQSDTKVKDYGFTEWAKGQMEYILGNNDIVYKEKGGKEHGPRCFLTGFDDHSAAYPHHRASSGLTKCEDPDEQLYVLFGALCGGPTGQDEHNDLTGDWRENEVTIDYNAACPGAAAALYLAYKDQYPQSITPDFPPVNDGGRASKGGGGEDGEGGASGTWVEACGIDDFTDTGAGVTKVSLMVKSTSGKTPKNLTVRYYIDTTEISDFSRIESSILYDQVSAEAAPDKCTIQQPKKWDKDSKYAYVEMDWGDYNFPNCGKKLQFKVGFYYGDKWDPTNDPSYKDLKIYKEDDAFFGTGNEVRTDNICVYSDGVLIGGIEPDGTKPEVSQPQNPTPTTTSITTTTTTKTTTTTTTTDPKIVTEKGMRGDVDCSKDVDVSDAVLLARFLAEDSEATVTETGMRNADCDGIAGVDSNDVIAILKHIAHIELLED